MVVAGAGYYHSGILGERMQAYEVCIIYHCMVFDVWESNMTLWREKSEPNRCNVFYGYVNWYLFLIFVYCSYTLELFGRTWLGICPGIGGSPTTESGWSATIEDNGSICMCYYRFLWGYLGCVTRKVLTFSILGCSIKMCFEKYEYENGKDKQYWSPNSERFLMSWNPRCAWIKRCGRRLRWGMTCLCINLVAIRTGVHELRDVDGDWHFVNDLSMH